MPIVEIAWWTPTEAFEVDKSLIKPGLDFLKQVDGCQAVYSGFAEEEKTYFLFLVWESFQHHKALIDHPEYPQVIGLGPTVGEGGIKLNHVEFNKDFFPALSAPLTEVLALTLKEGKTKDELYTNLTSLASKIDAENTEEHRPVTWGPTLEDSSKFYWMIGWKSLVFHRELVQQPHIFPDILGIRSLIDHKLLHVDFAKHT